MGTKRFDPEAAVDAALETFWLRGYEGTSAQDLVEAMGINRGSLYATFTSKSALYRRALQRYVCHDLEAWHRALDVSRPLAETLREVLQANVEQLVTDETRRGCMLANAAAELRPESVGADQVRAALDQLHALLADALVRARDRGELPPDGDTDGLAAFLVTSIQGLRLVGKAAPDARRLHVAVEAILAGSGLRPAPRTQITGLPGSG